MEQCMKLTEETVKDKRLPLLCPLSQCFQCTPICIEEKLSPPKGTNEDIAICSINCQTTFLNAESLKHFMIFIELLKDLKVRLFVLQVFQKNMVCLVRKRCSVKSPLFL